MKTQHYLAQASFTLNNKLKILRFLFGAVLILSIMSCGTIPIGRYNPDPSLARGVVENLSFSNDITIINDQSLTEDHLIPFRKAVVNYNVFTQSIIDAVKMELERNGIRVTDSSDKKLYVKVTYVDLQLLSAIYRAYIDTEVKTGQDHIEFFRTTRASYASPINLDMAPTRPLNSAFKDMVGEIVKNKQIQEYMNN